MAITQKPIILDSTGQQIAQNIASHTERIGTLISGFNSVFVGEGSGLVPAPQTGDKTSFLRSDGSWVDLSGLSSIDTVVSSAATKHPLLLHSTASAGSSGNISSVLFTSGVNVVPSTNSLNVGGTLTTNSIVSSNATITTLNSSNITNTGTINQTGDVVVTGNVYSSQNGEFGNAVTSSSVTTGLLTASKVVSTGEVIAKTHSRVAAANGISDLIIRNDGANVYFLFSDYENGSWNSLRPLAINISTGNLVSNHSFTASAVYNAVWNDYAEFFPRGEETEAGDIVALDMNSEEERYIKATKDSILIAGAHSNTYAHLIGGETPPENENFVEYNLPKYIPVGLSGRIDVKFKGKAKKGHPVTISDVPGVGELYTGTGNIIGYIVDDYGQSSKEEIRLVKIIIRNN